MSNDMSRRAFLWLSGAAAASTSFLSLGATDRTSLNSNLMGLPHWVVTEAPFINGRYLMFHNDSFIQMGSTYTKMVRNKQEIKRGRKVQCVVQDYLLDVHVPENVDPHVEFFVAAERFRSEVISDLNKAMKTSKHSGFHNPHLITIVTDPFRAIPKEDRGFYIDAGLTHIVASLNDMEFSKQPASKSGEIPIELPNEIDMMFMMQLQSELKHFQGYKNASELQGIFQSRVLNKKYT